MNNMKGFKCYFVKMIWFDGLKNEVKKMRIGEVRNEQNITIKNLSCN